MINYILSQEEMDRIISKQDPQLVIFVKEYCPICKRYVDELMNKYNLSFSIFDVDNNKAFYKSYKMSMLFPETRIYKNNEILFCLGGQLYETQIEKVKGLLILNTCNGNNNQNSESFRQ